jgi:hypothetical protein
MIGYLGCLIMHHVYSDNQERSVIYITIITNLITNSESRMQILEI